MYDTVLAAFQRGAATEALTHARALVESRPNDSAAVQLLSAAQKFAGDHDAALATLDDALGRDPDNAHLHLARAGLLLQARELDEAQAALARSIGLDPNQFPAYVMQAHMALGRGDLDEADRLARTAMRIAPDHPQIGAIQGMVALRRGRPEQALAILAKVAERAPDEPILHYPFGLALLANGHVGFAEQAFRKVLQTRPDAAPIRALIAELMARQGRAAEAVDELLPLLEQPDAPLSLYQLVGELEIHANRLDDALAHLKHALAAVPDNRRTLTALVTVWRKREDLADARSTLDAALATHPAAPPLWLARLGIEEFASEPARAVIDRWIAAMPDHAAAHMALVTALDATGDRAGAERAAERVVEIEPGHAPAELRLVDALLKRDPEAAIDRVRTLIERAPDPQVQRGLKRLLGQALDTAGRPAQAVDTWLALHAEAAERHQPLPEITGYTGPWPETAPLPENPTSVLLIWGAPGSMVERVVRTFEVTGAPVRTDRLGASPPNDLFQRVDTAAALVDGRVDGRAVVTQWRTALQRRGAQTPTVIDWLPLWDNAYLIALRAHLPEAALLTTVRDPRDMLLDWLAFGSPVSLRFGTPVEAARWLAASLSQLADLQEQDAFPHRIIRLDGIAEDPRAVAQALADALGGRFPVPPIQALGAARMPTGHWERFASVLDEAFDVLAPVAARLGYTV